MASDTADDPELPLRAMALRAGVAVLALGVGSRQRDSTTDLIGECYSMNCRSTHPNGGARRSADSRGNLAPSYPPTVSQTTSLAAPVTAWSPPCK